MNRPNYHLRCAQLCVDRRGEPRDGDQWVHVYGVTRWVCSPCAEHIGRLAHIPSRGQLRRATARREAPFQVHMDEVLLREECLGEAGL